MLRNKLRHLVFFFAASTVVTSGCEETPTLDPCELTTCSSHGECVTDDNGHAACECDEGYEADGLRCIEIGADGDADADGDGDGDADADGDSDADATGPPSIIDIVASEECVGTGVQVRLSAVTSGEISSYFWDFGDGVTSEQAEPSHFYASVENFDVSLTVTGPEGTDSVTEEGFIRVIEPGWTRLLPNMMLGDVNDIWQDPSEPDSAFAVGRRGLAVWDGRSWDLEEVVGARELRKVVGSDAWSGVVAMMLGKDDDWRDRVFFRENRDIEDADPDRLLPEGEWDEYVGVHMTWSHTAIMAVNVWDGDMELWSWEEHLSPQWRLIETSGYVPSWASDFAATRDDGWTIAFLLRGSSLYRSSPLELEPVEWTRHDTVGYFDTLALVDGVTVWMAGYDGALVQANWNNMTESYTFEDFTSGLWTIDHHFTDLALTHDGDTLFGLAIDETVSPRETIFVQVDGASGGAPDPGLVDMDSGELMTGSYTGSIAVYDETQLWYGTRNGYIARWDGAAWENITGELTTGSLGLPSISPSGVVYVPTNGGNPLSLLTLHGDEWVTHVLTGEGEPAAAWPVDEDDVWVLGEDAVARYYNGSEWTAQDLSIPADSRIWAMWGSSSTDIWAVGRSDDDGAMLLRYNGIGWVRDSDVEELLGEAFWIEGSASDDVYASSQFGYLLHYDGSDWARVEHDLFAEPANMGQCVTDDPGADCSGDGFGFTSFAVAPDGTLYAGLSEGSYFAIEGSDARCLPGEYRCVMQPVLEQLAQQVASFDGSSWSVHDLPDPGVGLTRLVYWMEAMSADRAYAVTIAVDLETGDDELVFEVLTWDGSEWTPLAEQPSPAERVAYIFGREPGEFYGLGMESLLLMRYQTCGH